MGSTVFEKHFTLNHSWKGTDHKYSLEPEGLRKQIRDLKRIDLSLGNGNKIIMDFEKTAREKMGKSIYTSRDLEKETIIKKSDINTFLYYICSSILFSYPELEAVDTFVDMDFFVDGDSLIAFSVQRRPGFVRVLHPGDLQQLVRGLEDLETEDEHRSMAQEMLGILNEVEEAETEDEDAFDDED